jgi:predicted transcriptional regulator of viral defense system
VVPTKSRKALRKRLVEVAAGQSGYFSASQALEAGYSYPAQHYHAVQQNWLRVGRGIYRLPEWPSSPHEDLVRWTLWSGQEGVVSHETALSVHDLGDVNPAKVHLSVPLGFRAKAAGVVLHRSVVAPTEKQEHSGFWVTTPLRSLIDVAAGSLDLDHIVTAVREALGRGLVTTRRLRERADAAGDRSALRVERALAAIEASASSTPHTHEPVRATATARSRR